MECVLVPNQKSTEVFYYLLCCKRNCNIEVAPVL